MSESIHLTPAQIAALSRIQAPAGVVLHQLAEGGAASAEGDVYATAVGERSGVRIAPDGAVGDIGETLPAS